MGLQSFGPTSAGSRINTHETPVGHVFRGTEIIGAWNVRSALRHCSTGECLRILDVTQKFSTGGAVVEKRADSPTIPGGPGHGTWRHIEGLNYGVVLRFYRFFVDGRVADSTVITRRLTLDECCTRFSGTALVEVFDESGTLIQSYGATESGERIEFFKENRQ